MPYMHLQKEHLRNKGWSETEIKHTHTLIKKFKRVNNPKFLEESLYWLLFFLMCATTVAISVWIIPLFALAESSSLYFALIIIALAFGATFSIVIKDLETLQKHHHLLLSFTIPVIAFLSFFIVTSQTAAFMDGVKHNALLISFTFTFFFMLPYAMYLSDNDGY